MKDIERKQKTGHLSLDWHEQLITGSQQKFEKLDGALHRYKMIKQNDNSARTFAIRDHFFTRLLKCSIKHIKQKFRVENKTAVLRVKRPENPKVRK